MVSHPALPKEGRILRVRGNRVGRHGQLEVIELRSSEQSEKSLAEELGSKYLSWIVVGFIVLTCFLMVQVQKMKHTCSLYNEARSVDQRQIDKLQTELAESRELVRKWQLVATQPPGPDTTRIAIIRPEEETLSDEENDAIVNQFGSSEESGPGR